MIERRLEYLLEHLHPLLAREQVALSQLTAAAVHHLTARDITRHLELLTVEPQTRPDSDRLAEQLRDQIAAIQPVLHGDDRAASDEPVHTTVDEDRITIRIPTGEQTTTVAVSTLDPDLQPAATRPRSLRRHGVYFLTLDAVTVARQLTMRWLTDPRDSHRCLEVALAADRVGPGALWTPRMAAATTPLIEQLHDIVSREGPLLIDSPTIPRQIARHAQRGLKELERHLADCRTRGRAR